VTLLNSIKRENSYLHLSTVLYI